MMLGLQRIRDWMVSVCVMSALIYSRVRVECDLVNLLENSHTFV